MNAPTAGDPALPQPAPVAVWVLAARPKTLPAAVAPVLVGTAVAIREGGFAPLAALAALVVALLLQIAANFANDVFDFRRGADTGDRLGPVRVTQSGLLSADRVLLATVATLGLATIGGLYLVWRGGWPIALLGILAIVAALAYTAGPVPLGYLGLGEVVVFVFFGLVGVAATAYVQTRQLSALALVASVPIGCLVAAILVVNNLRDRATDAAAGKRTLAVRLGDARTRGLYALLLIVAYVTLPAGAVAGIVPGWWWLPLVTTPIAVTLVRSVGRASGRALNPLLGGTARLALLFGLVFAVALVL